MRNFMPSPLGRLSIPYLIGFLFICIQTSFAVTVNRLNGGASITYVDFSIAGDVVPLELVRTYNSITAVSEKTGWPGAFGWGWSSDFETTMRVTPEGNVLLRDGNTGNNVLFRAPKENAKAIPDFINRVKRAYFTAKTGKPLSAAKAKKLKLPKQMASKLKADPIYRMEMASRYKVSGNVPKKGLLVSTNYGFESMRAKGDKWVRRKDGVKYVFDSQGRLIRKEDKNGFYLVYKYSVTNKLQLSEILARNQSSGLKFFWRSGKIVRVTDNKGNKSTYDYDKNKNLIRTVDSNGQEYTFKYTNKKFPHLLTKIVYPKEKDKKGKAVFREVRYDANGLAVFHRDKQGYVAQYLYGKSPNDPKNNFWTRTAYQGAAPPGKPSQLYEAYFLKKRADGSKYLYKKETNATLIQGKQVRKIKDVTVYTACCGKPLQTVRNGRVTKFKYYENGLLMERVGPREDLKVEYDASWDKVRKISLNGVSYIYDYDKRGNLNLATNLGTKQRISLSYDGNGHISKMKDSTGRELNFSNYSDFGKPRVITQKGIGTIKIRFGRKGGIARTRILLDGKPNRTPTTAESQRVVTQVMASFKSLLDIIRPAEEINNPSSLALGGF